MARMIDKEKGAKLSHQGRWQMEEKSSISTLTDYREAQDGVPCQNNRNPWHRHRMKVSGWTTASTGRHSHHQDSHIRAARVVA